MVKKQKGRKYRIKNWKREEFYQIYGRAVPSCMATQKGSFSFLSHLAWITETAQLSWQAPALVLVGRLGSDALPPSKHDRNAHLLPTKKFRLTSQSCPQGATAVSQYSLWWCQGWVWVLVGWFLPPSPFSLILNMQDCDGDWYLLMQHDRLRYRVASSNAGKISLHAEERLQEQKTNLAHECGGTGFWLICKYRQQGVGITLG